MRPVSPRRESTATGAPVTISRVGQPPRRLLQKAGTSSMPPAASTSRTYWCEPGLRLPFTYCLHAALSSPTGGPFVLVGALGDGVDGVGVAAGAAGVDEVGDAPGDVDAAAGGTPGALVGPPFVPFVPDAALGVGPPVAPGVPPGSVP